MSYAPARFTRVDRYYVGNTPTARHIVDQLGWFSAGMCNTGRPIEDHSSAVRFHLPYSDASSPAFVIVTGNNTDAAVYFIRERREPSTADKRRLFAYGDVQNLQLHNVVRMFTTDVSPFLHSGEYSPVSDRVYDFPLLGGDMLSVVSHGNNDAADDEMDIIFVQDPREGDPLTVARLRRDHTTNWEAELFHNKPFGV